MPAYYIGEHVVISGTLEGGRRLNWVNRVVSAMSAASPLYPHEPTTPVRPATSEKRQNRKSRVRLAPNKKPPSGGAWRDRHLSAP